MDLSKHLEKAAEATKRRNYPFAVNLYGQLLALQPDNGAARAGLREALFKKAEQKAPSRLFALLLGFPHLLMAWISRLCGKHGAAAKAYERYLVLDPRHEEINLKLGEALQRAGCRNSAAAVYRAYAQHDQRSLAAARQAGLLLYELGQHQDALALLEQALRIDPRDQESLKARKNLAAEGALRSSGIEGAKSSRELIKDKEAQRRLEKADRLQLSPEELQKGIAELEPKLAAAPEDTGLLAKLADLKERVRDLEGAIGLLQRAQTLAPDAERLNKLGELRLRLQEQRLQTASAGGDEVAAMAAARSYAEMRVTEYRRRVQQQPTDFALRFELGSALLELGQTDAAIAELQLAIKDPRKKAESFLGLGKAFRKKGLADLALGQLEKALEASGPSGPLGKQTLYEMGSVAHEAGRAAEALAHFSRILEQDIGFLDVAQKVQELKSARPA